MKQTAFKLKTHGGKRPGAGRKRTVDEGAHVVRPELDGKKPLHITVRLRDDLPGLRNDETFKRLQIFMKATQSFGLRINHFSILKNHLHMIAEAENTEALQKGMMSLNGRLGRWLRKRGVAAELYPRGLFKGRYHVQIIQSSRQMKNALKYVLLNASKHFRKCPYIDLFSSGAGFAGWSKLLGKNFCGLIREQVLGLEYLNKGKTIQAEGLAPPVTWLGRMGWQRN